MKVDRARLGDHGARVRAMVVHLAPNPLVFVVRWPSAAITAHRR